MAGQILQPMEKSESHFIQYFSYWEKKGTMSAEFAFAQSARHPPVIRLVLIANNDKRHIEELDFAQLR
jgi:hypothetical protein